MVAIAPVALLLGNRRFRERIVPDLPTEALPGGSIWIHALSVGEVISALPLVESLSERHPNRVIVFTVTTSKGMAVARNALRGRVGALLFMPLDFWWSIRRVVQWIRPSVFLLVETDLWPGILGCLQGQGTPSILVNGRISPRTLRAYRRFPVFVREVFRFLELCLMQSDLDVQRLVEVGVDPSKVKAVGNIKFDRWWEPMGTEERAHWMESLCLNPQNVVWVAGSTHRGEEEIILRTFGRLRPGFPNLRLIIAPRQVEEADEIVRKASEMDLKAVLRTRLGEEASLYDVLVLNTLGELGRVYGLGKIAFVGGSLVPFGGHNLLEPASFGCPVLFGPHMHNFVTMSEALVEAGAGWRVPDEKALGEKVTILLEEQHLRDRMGRRARQFVQDNQGALEGVMQRLALYVEMPERDLR